jgi:hypothetical protein
MNYLRLLVTCQASLVWCSRNPLNNLGVIPGKLATASATRNPGKSKTSGYPLSRYDGGRSLLYYANFSSRTLACFSDPFYLETKVMKIIRLYTGTDNESHFEEKKVDFTISGDTEVCNHLIVKGGDRNRRRQRETFRARRCDVGG